MKLVATIKSVIVEDGELSVTLKGWAETDPSGTYPRPLGTINVPANQRNNRAYYIGRRIIIEVSPA